jgi:hypothetical protein
MLPLLKKAKSKNKVSSLKVVRRNAIHFQLAQLPLGLIQDVAVSDAISLQAMPKEL